MVFDFDQYSRPIWIYNVYIAVYLLVTMFGLQYVRADKVYTDKSKMRSFLFTLFYIVFAMFYCINSDYFRYRTYVQYVADGYLTSHRAEQVYYYLAAFVNGNFELYRLIIWGGAIVLTAWSSKKLKVPVYMSLLIWFMLFYNIVCYARASLAMAVLYAGATLIITHKKNIYFLAMGIILCALSVVFHRSMIIAVMGIPVLFIKFSRRSLLMYGLFLMIGCLFFIELVSTDPELLGEEYGEQFLESNAEIATGRWERQSLKNYISSGLGYGLFYVPLAIGLKKIMDKRNAINSFVEKLYWLAFTVALIATAFWFYFGFNNIYFYRVLYMTAAPISIVTAHMYHQRIIGKTVVKFLFIYSVVYHLLFLYTTITTHNIN